MGSRLLTIRKHHDGDTPPSPPCGVKWAAAALYILAAMLLFIAIMVMWEGNRWEFHLLGMTLSAKNAMPRLVGAVVAFLLAVILGSGAYRSAKLTGMVLAKFAMMLISLSLAFFAGEWFTRGYLQHTQGFNTMDDLQTLEQSEGGREENVHSGHPLAHIVQISSNNRIVYELKPNMNTRFGHTPVMTNREGFREKKDYPVERPPHSVRIVGIGDSGMFGWAVYQHENYLNVLESNLVARADGVQYEVINTGVPGYNTFQEVEMLKHKGLKYKPDIVVLGWSVTDYEPPFFLYKEKKFDEKNISYLYYFLFEREKYRELIQPTINTFNEVDSELVDPDLYANAGEPGVRNALAELKRLGVEHGFKVIGIGSMDKVTSRIFDEIGIPYYNALTEIPKGTYPEDYAVYQFHPMAGGHRALGERLAKRLDELGWLTPKSVISYQ